MQRRPGVGGAGRFRAATLRGRLSYRRAAEIFTAHTQRLGTDWTLRRLRAAR